MDLWFCKVHPTKKQPNKRIGNKVEAVKSLQHRSTLAPMMDGRTKQCQEPKGARTLSKLHTLGQIKTLLGCLARLSFWVGRAKLLPMLNFFQQEG